MKMGKLCFNILIEAMQDTLGRIEHEELEDCSWVCSPVAALNIDPTL